MSRPGQGRLGTLRTQSPHTAPFGCAHPEMSGASPPGILACPHPEKPGLDKEQVTLGWQKRSANKTAASIFQKDIFESLFSSFSSKTVVKSVINGSVS